MCDGLPVLCRTFCTCVGNRVRHPGFLQICYLSNSEQPDLEPPNSTNIIFPYQVYTPGTLPRQANYCHAAPSVFISPASEVRVIIKAKASNSRHGSFNAMYPRSAVGGLRVHCVREILYLFSLQSNSCTALACRSRTGASGGRGVGCAVGCGWSVMVGACTECI